MMRYDEQRRVCETAGGWPFSTKPAGQQYPVQGAFNPRVAGSNPARPTPWGPLEVWAEPEPSPSPVVLVPTEKGLCHPDRETV